MRAGMAAWAWIYETYTGDAEKANEVGGACMCSHTDSFTIPSVFELE